MIAENEVGSKMKMVRLAQRLTQTEMAERMGISMSQYSKAEIGDRNLGRGAVEKFCSVNQCEKNWLLFGEKRKSAIHKVADDAGLECSLPGDWPETLHKCAVEKRHAVEVGVRDFKMDLCDALKPAIDLFKESVESKKNDGRGSGAAV